jgi:hypothetical protein
VGVKAEKSVKLYKSLYGNSLMILTPLNNVK